MSRAALRLALLAAAGGCAAQEAAPRHLVLVSVDTLRADRLGAYGYALPTSPRIDALARQSTVFDNAIATCPATAPAVASILTGLHRAAHGVDRNRGVLLDEVHTLAEILRAAGYRTLGVVANPLLVRERAGFDQGFDAFLFSGRSAAGPGAGRFRGELVLEEVRRLLAEPGDAPLFLWTHFMDPHGPYTPHAGIRERFPVASYRREGDRELAVVEENYGLGVVPGYQRLERSGASRSIEPAELRARYDGEVRYTDAQVGELVDLLEARGLFQSSLFALTADHGESLGEHDYWFQHGFFAYEDALRVPLLLRAPGLLPEGLRIPWTASLIDLAPTLLELLQLPGAERMEGRSLLPLVEGQGGDRPAFAQTYYGNQLASLRLGPLKYIRTPPPPPAERDARPADGWRRHWPRRGGEELYDLAADPGETRDLAGERAEVAGRLGRSLETWLGAQARSARVPAPRRAEPELDRLLESLGYGAGD